MRPDMPGAEGSPDWWLSAATVFTFFVPSQTWPGEQRLATIERRTEHEWVVVKEGFLLDKKLMKFCLDRPPRATCRFRTKGAALESLKKWERWAEKEAKRREVKRQKTAKAARRNKK